MCPPLRNRRPCDFAKITRIGDPGSMVLTHRGDSRVSPGALPRTPWGHHDSHATITGLSSLQGHLSLASNRPRGRDIHTPIKALRAQATNCIRLSVENNDFLEFLGDGLVNLITALIFEEVKIDKCHHTVRMLGYLEYLLSVCSLDMIRNVGSSLRCLQ